MRREETNRETRKGGGASSSIGRLSTSPLADDQRKKRSVAAITALALLLGWSALYDSRAEDSVLVTQVMAPPSNAAPERAKLVGWPGRLMLLVIVGAGLFADAERPAMADVVSASSPCTKLLDFSGSVTDDPAMRSWFASVLSSVLELEGSSGAEMFVVYGDQPRILDLRYPSAPSEVVAQVVSSMGSREWGDPLAALELTVGSSPSCLVHLTDGTLDLPPALQAGEAAYRERLLSIGDELGRAGKRVLTVAASDESGDLWREFAQRSGGAYLVLPDEGALSAAFSSFGNPDTPISPSSLPAPTPGSTNVAVEPTTGASGFEWGVWTPLVLVGAICVAVVAWTVIRLGSRPAIAGWLESDEVTDD